MRALFSFKTIKKVNRAPLIKKIQDTYISMCVTLTIILSLIFYSNIEKRFSESDSIFIYITFIKIVAILILILMFLINKIIRQCISPIINLINHFKSSSELKEIEISYDHSQEIIDLYNIINSSIKRINEYQQQSLQNEKNAAIAMTTQMVAHDVRKPFSMLKCTVDLLLKCKTQEEFKKIIDTFLPSIEKSITKVNGFITDIMEIGSNSEELHQNSIEIIPFLENIIKDTFLLNSRAFVEMEYQFNHDRKIFINPHKMERVFANILENALQAMKYQGKIWIHTKDVIEKNKVFVEFCIGNNNSYIEKNNIQNLFKTFYTLKQNGTGLGLAIAEKVIQEHGGTIWCISEKNEKNPKGKVEFKFTIPATDLDFCIDINQYSLPLHSSELHQIKNDFDTLNNRN
ncbi:MAG: sensor histidine kinase [Spirobacillus cienkowskii]|jgi:signal transduction histidine kinase|uniref:histidine kinase n=1 Tax=Spirobacillus cienkowskii TaxID=495820 RepID=A0A369KRW8_9BACT|nr:MAG: sensor histidine kinase [Spirobacillus cienkowskii]